MKTEEEERKKKEEEEEKKRQGKERHRETESVPVVAFAQLE